jgi:hypothetical protein
MTAAQSWLIVGGLLNLFIGTLAAYALYWVRVSHPNQPAPHYALVAHRITVLNGVLLLSLSLAIEHTHFTPAINTMLAIFEVVATLLADGRMIFNWARGLEDEFAQGTELQRRFVGFANLLHLVAIAGILFGVTRTAIGL